MENRRTPGFRTSITAVRVRLGAFGSDFCGFTHVAWLQRPIQEGEASASLGRSKNTVADLATHRITQTKLMPKHEQAKEVVVLAVDVSADLQRRLWTSSF